MVVTAFVNVKSNRVIVRTGMKCDWTGKKGLPENEGWPRMKGFLRCYRLIQNGMLLELEVRIIDPREILIANGFSKEDVEDIEHEFPDLSWNYCYEEFTYDEEQLGRYMKDFAGAVLPELKLENASEKYIWKNLSKVTEYLAAKLRSGNLRFYRQGMARAGEAIVFGDFSNPGKPTFLYPAFGLKAITCERGYIPWKPCHLHEHEYNDEPCNKKPKV